MLDSLLQDFEAGTELSGYDFQELYEILPG
jgi:hypothetical protein